jgi:tetratricopeptide (TPR) repeat protein
MTRSTHLFEILVVAGLIGLTTAAARAQVQSHDQHDQHAPAALSAKDVGSIDFATTCAPAVKDAFNRGAALLHSFWFPEAIATFEGVLKTDGTCAIAHWGIAMSRWGNPFGGQRAPNVVVMGKADIDRALALPSGSARERGFITAAAELFRDSDPGTQRARVVAYEAAMEKVARDNPSGLEAQIFYALAVNQTAVPTDKTYAQQLKAAGILEPLFARHPSHPGLAHYIIHAYDSPALADKALVAARSYASLAPAVPHALHMPSHTFTRVGYWRESIETNLASANAARASKSSGDELHALDYQVYAYLQTAQDAAAQRAMMRGREVVSTGEGATAGVAGAGSFALAAMPARYALERRAWADAARLEVLPASTPYTQAMTHFARALGLARSGQPAKVTAELEAMSALQAKMVELKDPYWTEQINIQRRVADAWRLFAMGQRDEGITALRAAADAEDATDKAAVTPGPLAPGRELLGFMLLEAGRARDAVMAFEATAQKEPNRFLGLYGLATAAMSAGDTARARSTFARLVEIAKDGDATRPELAEAKRALAAR